MLQLISQNPQCTLLFLNRKLNLIRKIDQRAEIFLVLKQDFQIQRKLKANHLWLHLGRISMILLLIGKENRLKRMKRSKMIGKMSQRAFRKIFIMNEQIKEFDL